MTSAAFSMATEAADPAVSNRRPGLRSVPPSRRIREWYGLPSLVPSSSGIPKRTSHRGPCPPGAGCSRSDWLVTAPQQLPRSASVDRGPWGTFHVKENGGLVTACGQYAVSWLVFWDYEVSRLDPAACPTCLQVMLGPQTNEAP